MYVQFSLYLAAAATLLSDLEELPSVKLGDFILEFELEELSPEMKEVARKELRETPDVARDAVVALRDLLKGKRCQCDKPVSQYKQLRKYNYTCAQYFVK